MRLFETLVTAMTRLAAWRGGDEKNCYGVIDWGHPIIEIDGWEGVVGGLMGYEHNLRKLSLSTDMKSNETD